MACLEARCIPKRLLPRNGCSSRLKEGTAEEMSPKQMRDKQGRVAWDGDIVQEA